MQMCEYYTIESEILELSKKFESLYLLKNEKEILKTIEIAQKLAEQETYNLPSKMQLYYDIATAYHDIRLLNKKYCEDYLEKEIFNYRKSLDLFEDRQELDNLEENNVFNVCQYIAMRCYTNLGNSYSDIGRYISAIDCFSNALLINDNFAMASLNLSRLLFRYANHQIEDYQKNYFDHACYYYYQQTQKNKEYIENPNYLDDFTKYILLYDSNYREEYLSKDLELPNYKIEDNHEKEYRYYLGGFGLFLDPCLDLIRNPCFFVDSLQIVFQSSNNIKNKELIGLFNQIKQEYNWSRYLWYEAEANKFQMDYVDKQLDLIDIGDGSDYSLRISKMKNSFLSIYSLFDRIGYLINEYFEIGLTGKKISFKNVWKKELKNRKGAIYFEVPNPILEKYANNPFVMAMYWLQKDFYEEKTVNITLPKAISICEMRNDFEHNCLRIGKTFEDTFFTKYINEFDLENNTYKLLKLAREMIIYLCLAINYNQKSR